MKPFAYFVVVSITMTALVVFNCNNVIIDKAEVTVQSEGGR